MKANITSVGTTVGASAHFHFVETLDFFVDNENDAHLDGPVSVDILLTNTGHRFLARFDVNSTIAAQCSRCLEEYSFPLHLSFEEEYEQGSEGGLGATQHVDNEAKAEAGESPDVRHGDGDDIFLFHGDVVDFSEAIRQNLALSLPMKFVCRESCKGLCPNCGKNLNEGDCSCEREEAARWSPLREALKRVKV